MTTIYEIVIGLALSMGVAYYLFRTMNYGEAINERILIHMKIYEGADWKAESDFLDVPFAKHLRARSGVFRKIPLMEIYPESVHKYIKEMER